MDPRQVLCVTLAAADSSPLFGPLWRITFYTDSLLGAEVTVDKGGRTISGRMIVDRKKPLAQACKRAV